MKETSLIIATAPALMALLLQTAETGDAGTDTESRQSGVLMPGSAAPAVKVHSAAYVVPDVRLVRDDGREISLPQEMNDGRPVLLNFVFTGCGSTCPLMSQVFAEFQRRLGPSAARVHLMSISIDPEEDTPARLLEYAQRFGARPGWQHYTGTREASIETQEAFGVYRGDKMSHAPATLMRAAPGQPWVRIDGLATPDDLLQEYRRLVAAK